jgi:cell shape-determining protein MreC
MWYGIVIILIIGLFYFWPIVRIMMRFYSDPLLVTYSFTTRTVGAIPQSLFELFRNKHELSVKNRELEMNIERLENEVKLRDGLIQELRGQTASSSKIIVMYPLMRDITELYSTIVFSKGFKDGITEGALVYIRGREPVCIIKEVYQKTSLCKLFSAYGEEIDGVASSTTLFLKGDGGGSYTSEVSRDTPLQNGEPVYLKSDETMVLGTVVDIVRDNQAAFWKVYVRGAYNPLTSSIFYVDQ